VANAPLRALLGGVGFGHVFVFETEWTEWLGGIHADAHPVHVARTRNLQPVEVLD